MFRLTTTATNQIGSKKAAELLRLNNYEGQRDMNRRHVEKLLQRMKDGRFVKGQIAIGVHKASKTEFLMNGQHQLAAITEFDRPVAVTVDYYEVDSPRDFVDLFATFDVGRKRTQTHIVSAARVGFQDVRLKELPLRFIANIGSALLACSEAQTDFRIKPKDEMSKVELVEAHATEVLDIFNMLSAGDRPDKVPVGLMGAVILTFRASPKHAQEFWPNILSGASLEKNSPQWRLNKYVTAGPGAHKSGGWGKMFEECVTAIAWWNAWMTGDTRNSVKVGSMKDIPRVASRKAV